MEKKKYSDRPSSTTVTVTAKADVGLRQLLLAAVIMAVRALPPQTDTHTWIDKGDRHGAKILAALSRRRVTIPSSIVCALNLQVLILEGVFCIARRV